MFAFLFYRKVIVASQTIITFLFFVGLAGIISAIFIPQIYSSFTDNLFEENFLEDNFNILITL